MWQKLQSFFSEYVDTKDLVKDVSLMTGAGCWFRADR